jgi:hypothetical protein
VHVANPFTLSDQDGYRLALDVHARELSYGPLEAYAMHGISIVYAISEVILYVALYEVPWPLGQQKSLPSTPIVCKWSY